VTVNKNEGARAINKWIGLLFVGSEFLLWGPFVCVLALVRTHGMVRKRG